MLGRGKGAAVGGEAPPRSQIEYICCSEGLAGLGEVVPRWPCASDHRPVFAEVTACQPGTPLGHLSSQGLSMRGWTPASGA
eukprot:8054043-Lingulodinium_polyedra.AAC.1